MKVLELLNYLSLYSNDDELQIDIYDTFSQKLIDTTSDIIFNSASHFPTLKIDVETGKLSNKFEQGGFKR